MEEKYIYLIVAVVVIVILRIVYSMMKKSKKQKEELEKQEQEKALREKALAKKRPIATAAVNETPLKNKAEEKVEVVQETKKVATPVVAKNRAKREVPPHGKITKHSFNDFNGARILVAEDNLINQKVIKGLLADTGIEIKIANDGQEALDILVKDSNFALILMDAHMPNVDGFEATRQIRANPAYEHIAVIALSGDTATDDLKKMSDAGMEKQLEKPLKIDALYDILYAYTNCDNELQEAETEVQELNVKKGLEICGGDEGFYNEILNEFIQTYQDPDELQNFLKSGKLQEADKLLLDIIGVTSNIGAEKLNNIANVIKESLNDSQEKSYLTLIEEYKMHLTQIIKDIKEYQKK